MTRVILFWLFSQIAATPNFQMCLEGDVGVVNKWPFCDHTLTISARITDLLGRMTLQEKIGMMGWDARAAGVPRLGITNYSWNTEMLHGLGARCHTVDGKTRCPTIFPAPPGLGATFNKSLWRTVGKVISDELRAFSNTNGHRVHANTGIGVNAWGPNVNNYRDPRWGRNVEVPGEDPTHAAIYATEYTRGVQGFFDSPKESGGYIKVIAALKHFTAYSVEAGRGHTNFWVSKHDIEDTYLPPYRMAIQDANNLGIMCSYASVNGVPMCGSKQFLHDIAREQWGFEGYVVTDCGAIENMYKYENFSINATHAAATALLAGVDINCGSVWNASLGSAVRQHLVSETGPEGSIDASLRRTFGLLFRAGLFDPLEKQPYTQIPFDVINSSEHWAASLDAARQAHVLLKNCDVRTARCVDSDHKPTGTEVLPLGVGNRVAVIGPHAMSRVALVGNYFSFGGNNATLGIPGGLCPDPINPDSCVATLAEGISSVNDHGGGTTTTSLGCTFTGNLTTNATRQIDEAVRIALVADTVVLALGSAEGFTSRPDEQITCGEGHDRTSIGLTTCQLALAQAVLKVAKTKVVVVMFNGGLVSIDELVKEPKVGAIVEAFFPGNTGGQATAETLFGLSNRFSRLAVTMYPSSYVKDMNFTDMNLTDGVGRGYRYYSGRPIFSFLDGLSYTAFSVARTDTHAPGSTKLRQDDLRQDRFCSNFFANSSVLVTNDGPMAGDAVVVLVIMRDPANSGSIPPDPQAKATLLDFARVSLVPGTSKSVVLSPPTWKKGRAYAGLTTVDPNGRRLVSSGTYSLVASVTGGGSVVVGTVVVERDFRFSK